MKQKEQTVIQALIDSFDWGVMVIIDRQSQVLMNRTFITLFRIPEELQEFVTYDSQISYICSQLRDADKFFTEIHDTEVQPLLETQELFHMIDGRSLEVSSKPVAIDQLVVGRIWHFHEFNHYGAQTGATFVMSKRQSLISTVVAQTYHQRLPKEILSNVVNRLGEVFAIERALIYQLDGQTGEAMRFEWTHQNFSVKCTDYYRYFQENPWVWAFYEQVQCVHLNQTGTDPARKVNQLLQQLGVKTCLSFPIIVGDRLWGVLLLHCCHEHRDWLPEEIEFLEILSNQMAIAIQQTEIREQLTNTQNQIKATNTMDELTLIPNAKRFEQVLEKEWQRLAREELPLTVLSCRVDFFDLYQETYGEELANSCLQQVSWAISLVCQRPADLVARCGRDEFGVILPNTDLDGALFIADQLISSIQKLKISHLQSPAEQYVSISIGVNAMVPTLTMLPSELVNSTRKALGEAIQAGGNQIKVGEILVLDEIMLDQNGSVRDLDW